MSGLIIVLAAISSALFLGYLLPMLLTRFVKPLALTSPLPAGNYRILLNEKSKIDGRTVFRSMQIFLAPALLAFCCIIAFIKGKSSSNNVPAKYTSFVPPQSSSSGTLPHLEILGVQNEGIPADEASEKILAALAVQEKSIQELANRNVKLMNQQTAFLHKVEAAKTPSLEKSQLLSKVEQLESQQKAINQSLQRLSLTSLPYTVDASSYATSNSALEALVSGKIPEKSNAMLYTPSTDIIWTLNDANNGLSTASHLPSIYNAYADKKTAQELTSLAQSLCKEGRTSSAQDVSRFIVDRKLSSRGSLLASGLVDSCLYPQER